MFFGEKVQHILNGTISRKSTYLFFVSSIVSLYLFYDLSREEFKGLTENSFDWAIPYFHFYYFTLVLLVLIASFCNQFTKMKFSGWKISLPLLLIADHYFSYGFFDLANSEMLNRLSVNSFSKIIVASVLISLTILYLMPSNNFKINEKPDKDKKYLNVFGGFYVVKHINKHLFGYVVFVNIFLTVVLRINVVPGVYWSEDGVFDVLAYVAWKYQVFVLYSLFFCLFSLLFVRSAWLALWVVMLLPMSFAYNFQVFVFLIANAIHTNKYINFLFAPNIIFLVTLCWLFFSLKFFSGLLIKNKRYDI